MDSFVFNSSVKNLIENNDNQHKHLFIFRFESTDGSCVDENLKYIKSIEKYLEIGKYIVIHGLKYKERQILRIKDRFASRIIWCVWGSDLYPSPKYEAYTRIKKTIKYTLRLITGEPIVKLLVNKKIGKFKAIFFGFPGDKYIINDRFGDEIKIYNALYPIGVFSSDIEKILGDKEGLICENKVGYKKLMLGHSAFPFLKHKKWLEILRNYNKKLELHLPLSYGDKKYADSIERKCVTQQGDNIHIVRNLMTTEEYVKYLNGIDWAVFDFNHQAAFGNMILLFYLKKRVYLPEDSIMFKTFRDMGLKVFNLNRLLDDLQETNINDDLSVNYVYAKNLIDKNNIIEQWKNAFDRVLQE